MFKSNSANIFLLFQPSNQGFIICVSFSNLSYSTGSNSIFAYAIKHICFDCKSWPQICGLSSNSLICYQVQMGTNANVFTILLLFSQGNAGY